MTLPTITISLAAYLPYPVTTCIDLLSLARRPCLFPEHTPMIEVPVLLSRILSPSPTPLRPRAPAKKVKVHAAFGFQVTQHAWHIGASWEQPILQCCNAHFPRTAQLELIWTSLMKHRCQPTLETLQMIGPYIPQRDLTRPSLYYNRGMIQPKTLTKRERL